MFTYTISEGAQWGKKCFIINDQDGNFTGSSATRAEADDLVKAWSGVIEEIAQPAFDYQAGMYGSAIEKGQDIGNSEADEDRAFGVTGDAK